jgi:uncharacterized protein YjbI with pentapeptide repeats
LTVPREIGDLPFASALRPFEGSLAAGEGYECYHFADLILDAIPAGNYRFLECAFTNVTLEGGRMRKTRFSDTWLRDVRLVATDLAETGWLDATLIGCAAAGVQAFGASLRRVSFHDCKLDSVNFRGATLNEVTFENCLLRDTDFGSAKLKRTRFPGSRLTGADFTKATLEDVDLRGAELGITAGYESLHGATIDSIQLVTLAPLLAHHLGITVKDD